MVEPGSVVAAGIANLDADGGDQAGQKGPQGTPPERLSAVARRWWDAFDSKDPETAQHCRRVSDYSFPLAAILGFSGAQLAWFRIGALLHDVGKTIIEHGILAKPGALTIGEWGVVRQHPVIGAQMLAASGLPTEVASMIRSHHEHWDGRGYPDGLRGENIPLAARMLCVADVYDALTSSRSYRSALSRDDALNVMAYDCGRILDPALFSVFRAIIK